MKSILHFTVHKMHQLKDIFLKTLGHVESHVGKEQVQTDLGMVHIMTSVERQILLCLAQSHDLLHAQTKEMFHDKILLCGTVSFESQIHSIRVVHVCIVGLQARENCKAYAENME